jgi:hypothetical protein
MRCFVATCLISASALGQQTGALPLADGLLREQDVLVVYDSRNPDSRSVAEYYAGSARVAGGAGGLPGIRPAVNVLDLASTGVALAPPGDISYANFVTLIRTPLRTSISAAGLNSRLRCLVLCKGLPHRIQDFDAPSAGDFVGAGPNDFPTQFDQNDANCASVDSELTMLWQDLNANEAGLSADSRSDGAVANPFWRSRAPIGNSTTANRFATKTFTASGNGPVWQSLVSGAARFTPGDMLLVCRLDGHTLADVRGMLDRARSFQYDTDTALVLLDESAGDNSINPANNGEFDNINSSMAALYDSDDYEQVRSQMTITDKRFLPDNILHNNAPNSTGFYIGPRFNWQAGLGIRINGPVVLLASYGSNHQLTFPNTVDLVSARMIFGESFIYPPGAIFNTIESWNARDLGGLGQLDFQQQEQVADFLRGGGTFAIGHVWEPLADAIPDNRYLALNFLLGNMTWAEAAWSSIPSLSWMHVVLGDPLARPSRKSEDINRDGRISIDDLYAWEQNPTDLNRSGAADAADRAVLLRVLRYNEKPDVTNRRP